MIVAEETPNWCELFCSMSKLDLLSWHAIANTGMVEQSRYFLQSAKEEGEQLLLNCPVVVKSKGACATFWVVQCSSWLSCDWSMMLCSIGNLLWPDKLHLQVIEGTVICWSFPTQIILGQYCPEVLISVVEQNLENPAGSLAYISGFLLIEDRHGHLVLRETERKLGPAFMWWGLMFIVTCTLRLLFTI